MICPICGMSAEQAQATTEALVQSARADAWDEGRDAGRRYEATLKARIAECEEQRAMLIADNAHLTEELRAARVEVREEREMRTRVLAEVRRLIEQQALESVAAWERKHLGRET